MAARPLPDRTIPIVTDPSGCMAAPWFDYFKTRELVPLVAAANDAAAAVAGVPINGFYRIGNVVQIRLT